MENYTLSLALFDYLPVIAAGFGLYLICKYCGSLVAYSGVWIVLIPAIALTGGVLKASWKLLYALNGSNIGWMSDQLFFFLATAYVMMAALILRSLRAYGTGVTLNRNWWLAPLALAGIIVAAAFYLYFGVASRSWSILLLATLSIANLLFLVGLIRHAALRARWLAVAAFSGNLVLSYLLVWLARQPQTPELQWIEEFLNLGNNSLLAVGAWLLLAANNVQTSVAAAAVQRDDV
ncbi:MAG: hypothetical protein K0U72_12695 [Gammaproteobacteria bacterium]|nr:hypothetical protein [Gammaproteobacteria bacterium]